MDVIVVVVVVVVVSVVDVLRSESLLIVNVRLELIDNQEIKFNNLC